MTRQLEYVRQVTRCPVCSGALHWSSIDVVCEACRTRFERVGDTPLLIAGAVARRGAGREDAGLMQFVPRQLRGAAARSRRFIRPSLVHRSRATRSLTGDFVASFEPGAWILNVGAGSREYGDRVVNLDVVAATGIHVVGVAERLPFRDEAFDGVIFQAVLEHVRDARAALSEILRVLRSNGAVFVEVPFIQGYHAAPQDHRRFTERGLQLELEQHGFVVDDTGIAVGPASAMAWITGEFLALLLSGRSGRVYRFVRLATDWLAWPIKWADAWLDTHEMAHIIASGVWARAHRPAEPRQVAEGER